MSRSSKSKELKITGSLRIRNYFKVNFLLGSNYSELLKEKMNARIGVLPLLQSEHDRRYDFCVTFHGYSILSI